jgi:hypothetical protein
MVHRQKRQQVIGIRGSIVDHVNGSRSCVGIDELARLANKLLYQLSDKGIGIKAASLQEGQRDVEGIGEVAHIDVKGISARPLRVMLLYIRAFEGRWSMADATPAIFGHPRW